ncbi:transcriptional regulator [Microbulbifer sp. PSTR4-B]|uniref:transcriptional regulator n=1 Tax=Microbulbifer sp. PSTR4-B TaxID=3243396 RepID=UPI00403A6E61
MDNIKEVCGAVKDLVTFFKSQAKAAKALGVEQPTVSNWLRGKTRVPAVAALRAEQLTGGAIRAVALCPELAELSLAADQQGTPEVQRAS